MATDIKVPTLGESVSSATVARWLKKAGESVSADEPVVELETDKVTVEVPAPGAGVLGDIQAQEGAEVEVGAVLARLETGAAPAKAGAAPTRAPGPAAMPSAGVNPPPRPLGPVSRPA
ncbi:MAG: dihydrolipoamide succinyltransferase, partial [Acetobacteraceae bacterium]|nr:dihydrolipoamide succinyltransferase [Acetobacteraceae bacterium]